MGEMGISFDIDSGEDKRIVGEIGGKMAERIMMIGGELVNQAPIYVEIGPEEGVMDAGRVWFTFSRPIGRTVVMTVKEGRRFWGHLGRALDEQEKGEKI
jgi:hypothetical protein